MRNTRLLLTASISGAAAVALGAFGAHGLKAILAPEQLNTFEIGVRYHYYHTFAMLIAGILSKQYGVKNFLRAGWLFFVGILLFSGSLYLLASREVLGISNWSWLGPITPIGGLFFIMAWLLMGWAVYQSNKV